MNNNNVIVVGAGPVGMCIALELAQRAIPVTILEAHPRWTPSGSRAIVLDRGSLRQFDRLDCLRPMLARGLTALRRRTFFGDTELYSTEFSQPKPGELPLFLNLSQTETEQILLERIEADDRIDLRWNHRVVSVHQDARGVTAETERSSFSGAYLAAADGCRSSVRRLCGLDFPGQTNPSRFLIVDIKAALPFPKEHHFHFDHRTNPGRTLLIVPQADNVWRIDWQLGDDTDEGALQQPEMLAARIKQVIGDVPFEILWSSCYRFHQRLMERMSLGRIFFAGDAAHLVNPFGARGMNSGIQDATNLARKLASVLQGFASPALLESYAEERGAANREHQRVTKRTMRFIAPRTALGRWYRDVVLRVSRVFPPARRLVNSGKMSGSPTPQCDRRISQRILIPMVPT